MDCDLQDFASVNAAAAKMKDRHRLNGYFAQRVPSLLLASSFRKCSKLCSSEMYASLEDEVPIKVGRYPLSWCRKELFAEKGLDCLVNNAGVMALADEATKDSVARKWVS